MQIKHVLLGLFVIPLLSCVGLSQSLMERELTTLAQEVATVANLKLTGHNIAIGDILDAEGNATQLGQLIAEELSHALSDKQGKFKIVDRTHFQTLMDEVDKRALLDDRTVLSLGKMVGISVVVYGTIYQQADQYRIFFKYALLEQQVKDNLCRSHITRLPSVDRMYQTPVKDKETRPNTSKDEAKEEKSPQSGFPPYQDGSLVVQFKGCNSSGYAVQCTYEVTSFGRSETFIAYSEGTFLQQGARRAAPTALYMNGNQSGYQLSTVLEANRPSQLIIQFQGVSGGASPNLNLHARTPTIFDFNYTNTNFLINKQ